MAERIKGYNENKDYTGFVCELDCSSRFLLKRLEELGVTPPKKWVPNIEGFIVKEDHGDDMLLQFYNIESDEELEETFWIKFEDATSYWT